MPESLLIRSVTFVFSVFSAVTLYNRSQLLRVSPQMLVTASRALLLKQWDWRQANCTRSWRAIHTVPVASMTFDSTSTLLATGQLPHDLLKRKASP